MLKKIVQVAIKRLSVREGVVLERDVHIGPFSIISSPRKLSIGRDTYIGKFCTIQVSGKIGNGVLIANSVGIVGRLDHEYRIPGVPVRNGRWVGNDETLASNPRNEILIEDDVWIGYGSIILSGIRIGRGSIIAAGSVVIADIPSYSIVVGAPARVSGQRFGGDAAAIDAHNEYLDTRYKTEAM